MPESARKPSLGDLPAELWRFIIPDPFDIVGVRVPIFDWNQRWLGLKKSYPHIPIDYIRSETEETVATLRALSQTNRYLRSLVLPRLWAVVQLTSVDQLGRLAETLKTSPDIAQHIRSFSFEWDLEDRFEDVFAYYERSLLDLAFSDRWALWNNLRLQFGAQAKWTQGRNKWCFFHAGVRFEAPGQFPDNETDFHASAAQRVGGSGPDGKGEDRIIKSADQFKDCVNQVVASLSYIEAFGWSTTVVQLPQQAFDALKSRQTLTGLAYGGFMVNAGTIHALPLWELAGNGMIRDLWLSIHEVEAWVEEEDEAKWTSFELPVPLPTKELEIIEMHRAVVCRTIIAAAKGGQLRQFFAGFFESFDYPFAVPSLLPYWLQMESWHLVTETPDAWMKSAATLRLLLIHASRWLGVAETSNVPREARELTCQDIQSLNAAYSDSKMPNVAPLEGNWETQPVERYLPWLEEDAELAQQVSNAWNALVGGGKAEEKTCSCVRCFSYMLETGRRLPHSLFLGPEYDVGFDLMEEASTAGGSDYDASE